MPEENSTALLDSAAVPGFTLSRTPGSRWSGPIGGPELYLASLASHSGKVEPGAGIPLCLAQRDHVRALIVHLTPWYRRGNQHTGGHGSAAGRTGVTPSSAALVETNIPYPRNSIRYVCRRSMQWNHRVSLLSLNSSPRITPCSSSGTRVQTR